MNRKATFESAADAAAAIAGKPEIAARIHALESMDTVITGLFTARCRLGLGLDEFARRMGITRRELERIEGGTDADLSPNQLKAYVRAIVAAVMEHIPGPAQTSPKARRMATKRAAVLA